MQPMMPAFHPPLSPQALSDLDRLRDGRSIHLSLVAVVCNSLHRHSGPARALDCDRCRHSRECAREVEATLAYVAGLSSRN